MATKKSTARKTRSKRKAPGKSTAAGVRRGSAWRKGGKRKILEELRELTTKARDEVAKLLKDEETGAVSDTELKTGLEEIAQDLKQIGVFQHML